MEPKIKIQKKPTLTPSTEDKPQHFLRQIIEQDLQQGRFARRCIRGLPDTARIRTRFPPEPNGYLHIGHAKSICLNFGLAADYGGVCHLRFDDTNPEKENFEYIKAIMDAVRWLGFDWSISGQEHLYFASDYFESMYTFATHLIKTGDAYVDEQSPEEIRHHRGNFVSEGIDSPYRNRSIEENLQRFTDMRMGKLAEGEAVLRAKIDMASPNLNMRDPTLYRIKHTKHHRTQDTWHIYPMYAFAHPIEDAIENITHSLCTLEFEDQRPFYDWLLQKLGEAQLINTPPPRQYEFSRLQLSYVVTSKRKLVQLVYKKHVHGWDDPRMPTIAGLRRRGYSPESIRLFVERTGVSKADNCIDYGILETALRHDLENKVARAMVVLEPILLTIINWDDTIGKGVLDPCQALLHPQQPERGLRHFVCSKQVWIDRNDFSENPPKGYRRLFPPSITQQGEEKRGSRIRLKYAYIVECTGFKKSSSGEVCEVLARLIPDTKSGTSGADAVKAKGVITWVSTVDALVAEVRLYDRLFSEARPDIQAKNFLEYVNHNSLQTVKAYVEPSLKQANPEDKFQFERYGYFVADRVDHTPKSPVFNRITELKDRWKK
jgi:glutaminyl-tRNA synthetase